MSTSPMSATPNPKEAAITPIECQHLLSKPHYSQSSINSPRQQQQYLSRRHVQQYPTDAYSQQHSTRQNQQRPNSKSPMRHYRNNQHSPTSTERDSRPNSRSPNRNFSRSPNLKQRLQNQLRGSSSRSPIPSSNQNEHSNNTQFCSSKDVFPYINNLREGSYISRPADMTVVVTRTDLFDSGTRFEHEQQSDDQGLSSSPGPPGFSGGVPHNYTIPDIAEYSWQIPVVTEKKNKTIAVCRAPQCPPPCVTLDYDAIGNGGINDTKEGDETKHVAKRSNTHHSWMHPSALLVDNNTPNPVAMNPELTKYWNQRRRLFSRFDSGIELDDEGWFSVTPEQIADHVASRMVELVRHNRCYESKCKVSVKEKQSQDGEKIIVLDAFCGCGGNAISFAKLSQVAQVICVDIDRTKLQRAANNASIYEIPEKKIVFVECNALFILQHCYRNGHFILDEPVSTPEAAMALMTAMPPPSATEICHGFQIGGIDLLPRNIDVVFLDPPWGGVDYSVFGKNGYDLQRNMRIQRPNCRSSAVSSINQSDMCDPGSNLNGFFDTFQTIPRNKEERKAQFNCGLDETNCANGAELLAAAALATSPARQVIYDIPRNTNRISLGESALLAGYRGTVKVEEHYLNGRLKTLTAYFGCDWNYYLSMQTPVLQQANHGRECKIESRKAEEAVLLQPRLDSSLETDTNDNEAEIELVAKEISTVFLPFLPPDKNLK